MKKKILILYTSIGLGHKSIAENIGFYLSAAGFEVKLYDAHKVQGGMLAVWGKKIYQWLVSQAPFVWNWLYNTGWFISATLPYRTKVAGHNYNNILSVIKEFNPDVVISTHNTVSAILDYLKTEGLYKGKFGIAFSDFHLHRFWLFETADFYLANIEEQKQEMVALGISATKIFVCGVTLKPKAEINIQHSKNKFEIEKDDKVVLLASGSQGFGVDESLIWELISKPKINPVRETGARLNSNHLEPDPDLSPTPTPAFSNGVKVLVLCGNNKEMFKNLSSKFAGSHAIILSYHSFMDELYAIADIFITKPGGLSVAEALNWKLPILVSHLLPGQEQHNYSYLQAKAFVMPEPINILDSVFEELETGSFKQSLRNNPALKELFLDHKILEQAINKTLDKLV